MINQSLATLDQRLRAVEDRFHATGYAVKEIVTNEFKRRWTPPTQAQTVFGVVTALAVALVDKTKQLALYQGVDEMIKNFTVRE